MTSDIMHAIHQDAAFNNPAHLSNVFEQRNQEDTLPIHRHPSPHAVMVMRIRVLCVGLTVRHVGLSYSSQKPQDRSSTHFSKMRKLRHREGGRAGHQT